MTSLGSLVAAGALEFSDGYRTQRGEHAPDGFRILRAGDVWEGEIHPDGPDFVSREYEGLVGRKTARAGDVVLTTKGTVGRVAVVGDLAQSVVYSPQLCYFRCPKPDVLRAAYLRYWLLGPEFIDQSSYLKGATDMAPYISLRDLAGSRITIPPVSRQCAIAGVLGALDDKIAANTRLLELANASATAMVTRDLPDQIALGNVASVVMGSSPKGESMNEMGKGIEFFQGVRDFGPRVPTSRVHTTEPVRMASAGDVLVSVRAPVGKINRSDRPLCIGRGLAAVTSTTETPHVLFHALRMAESAWQPFNSEGTVFGSISQTDLKRVTIPWSGARSVVALESELAALERRIDLAVDESRKLVELRDTLLPHLMSGRMSVREAEASVGAAL